MMAHVSLDNQEFYTPYVAVEPRPANRYLGSKAIRSSQNDIVVISSDSESDYGDLGDDQSHASDTSLPSLDELLRQPAQQKDAETGNIAHAEQGLIAISSAVSESGARKPSVIEGVDIDEESASRPPQQTGALDFSPRPPSTPALSRQSSASRALQTDQEPPVPATHASCEVVQASISVDATYGNTAEEVFHASPPGVDVRHPPSPRLSRLSSSSPGPLQMNHDPLNLADNGACEADQISVTDNTTENALGKIIHEMSQAPSPAQAQCAPTPDRLSSLPSLRQLDGKPQENMLHRGSTSEGDDDDGVEPSRTKPKPSQKRAAVRRRIDRPASTFDVDSSNTGEVEAVQQTNNQHKLRHPGRRRYNRTEAMEDEDLYHSSKSSESEQGEEDDEDFRPQPRKRRKTRTPTRASLPRTVTGRHIRLDSGVSRPRQVRKLAPGRKHSGRRSIPSPPSSQRSSEAAHVPMAKFGEWPLEGAVLKRATVNGLTTFQLEFTWAPCANHKHHDRALEGQPMGQREDASHVEDDQEEWEVQDILNSRTHYRKLQYKVQWVGWHDDQDWYNAEALKGSPHLLGKYHSDHPEKPGPPVRLEDWLRAYEAGIEVPEHPDDNKPVGAKPTDVKADVNGDKALN